MLGLLSLTAYAVVITTLTRPGELTNKHDQIAAKDFRSAADVICVSIHRLMIGFTYSSPRRETGVGT
jgi:hypothetical protein